MVRSVIPDSGDDSGEETSPYNFTSTIPPAAVQQQSASAALPNRDNINSLPVTTQKDPHAQLILGTGSTDSAVFQQIYNQHQLSTDATHSTPASQPDIQRHITQIILDHSTPTLTIAGASQLTQPPQEVDSFGTTSSANTIKKLKRSKTNIQDSSFTSPEASKNQNKMKRAKSMKSYPLTIEGSSQDITVNVADTGSYTTLTRGSQEGNLKYKKAQSPDAILGGDNSSHAEKDIYDFPGSSASGPTNRITKKMGAKTTMDIAKEKMKTYGKARRSKTMVPPSSQDAPLVGRRKDDNEDGINMGSTRLPSSPPLQDQAQPPKRSLAENIQRKKEEKAKAEKEKAASGAIKVGQQAEAAIKDVTKAKSPVKTYWKVKRSKTGIPSSSLMVADDNHNKRSTDDSQLDKHKKRKSDVHIDEDMPFELPQAKRYQRSKSTTVADAAEITAHGDVVALSSSQDGPVDQIPDTVVTPTASMPEPLLKSNTNTVLVPGTKSSDRSSAGNEANAKVYLQVNSNSPLVVESSVSVVKATKSSGSKPPSDKPSSTGPAHPGTPKLPCFDSSLEQAATIKSIIKKVDELVNSPVAAPAQAGSGPHTSSPLEISFDKGLVGQSIVVVTETTDAQKEQYVAVSVTGSEGDGHEHAATLPPVMSPARVEKWSDATVANSTWVDRGNGGYSGDKRAPTMEPLSSQPKPSSRRATKRSKTGLEETPSTRRDRSASVHSDVPPSSGGSDIVVKSSSRKVRRSKTMTTSDEPAKSSSQPRWTHVVKTVTTYEKLKDPDASPPSFPEVGASTEVAMENTQIESNRGTKRKSDVADLDTSSEQTKTQDKTQEELDFEMAKKLQQEMDKDDAEPETRAKRRAPSKISSSMPEPEPLSSQEAAGLPPPEMYKPRLSSRRSKSLSAKADTNAAEAFIDGLPRPNKGKGKKAASQKEAAKASEEKAADKENVEPTNEPVMGMVPAGSRAIVDTVMDDVPAPLNDDDDEGTVVATEMPKSSFNKEKQANAETAPAKLYAVPKHIGKTASKPAKAASAPEEDDAEDAVVAPNKRGRGVKAVIDTDESADELAVAEVEEQPVIPKTTARGRAAAKRAASSAAASKPAPKSKEVVNTDDDEDEDDDLPVKAAGRASRSKAAEMPAPPRPMAKSKEIIDTDASEDEEAPISKPASPAKALTPAPAPVARTPSLKARAGGVTRKTSIPGFKAPTITRNKSTSAETDVPQTPRKDKEKGSQEITPKSTPPGTGAGPTSHSPLRGGVVPLRVGLSKKTRLPSLLKIIRK